MVLSNKLYCKCCCTDLSLQLSTIKDHFRGPLHVENKIKHFKSCNSREKFVSGVKCIKIICIIAYMILFSLI